MFLTFLNTKSGLSVLVGQGITSWGVGRGTHSQGSKPARAFSIIGFAINGSRSVRTV